jgi:glycerophosphoryl diester phosphodiesterase
MHRLLLFAACGLAGLAAGFAQSPAPAPLWRAHAHNDYRHARPLADALAHGFRSVEADIWLSNGVLLVAHDFRDTSPEKTLAVLYLDPLRAFFRTNVWKGGPALTLLIDVKSDAEKTYAVLRDQLRGYADILTRFETNTMHTNAVIVIISGARAEAVLRAEPVRFAALDGREPDLEKNPPVALVPLVSDNWTKHFQWRGTGPMPEAEREKLRQLTRRAHAQGRRLRLWAAPDHEAGWKELFEAGADLVNTDKLAELERFLRARELAPP